MKPRIAFVESPPSSVCKQPDTPLMFIRLGLSWYPDRYGQSPGDNIFWLMLTLTAYLFSQVSLLPAVTVLHLHVLYPWVHIHLGHAGIKEKPQFLISHYLQANYAIIPSSIVHSVNIYLCPYASQPELRKATLFSQLLFNPTDKEYLGINTEAG